MVARMSSVVVYDHSDEGLARLLGDELLPRIPMSTLVLLLDYA